MAFGTQGYVSFSDYMRGNQDAITQNNQNLGTTAVNALNPDIQAVHAASDAAAAHTPDAIAAEKADSPTGELIQYEYKKEQDRRAAQYGDAILKGQPAPTFDTNPYSVAGKADDATRSYLAGNADWGGQKAEDAIATGQSHANDVANLQNWGGVFDAYKNQYKTGSQGAAFDATLAGGGLAAAGKQGADIGKGLNDYYNDAIHKSGPGSWETYQGAWTQPAPYHHVEGGAPDSPSEGPFMKPKRVGPGYTDPGLTQSPRSFSTTGETTKKNPDQDPWGP